MTSSPLKRILNLNTIIKQIERVSLFLIESTFFNNNMYASRLQASEGIK